MPGPSADAGPGGAATPAPANELQQIRTLIEQREYHAALAGARRLAERSPDDRDVLYSIAVSQRCLRQESAALDTLGRLAALHPDFSRVYQEIGYCRVGLRDAPGAIDALLRAVNRNPALRGSWAMLERLYSLSGDAEGASAAAAHVATLDSLPTEVVTATALFADRELDAAERMIRDFLLRHGDHIEAMRLLARIGLDRDVLDDAELLLHAVLQRQPDYRAARFDYATVLLRRHRHRDALAELVVLCQAEPANRSYRAALATARVGLGEFEQALRSYRDLLQQGPVNAELHLSIGHCLKTMGDAAAAVEAYREAARVRPGLGDAYWSLANLKTYRFPEEELARMRAALAAPGTPPPDRVQLCFALGKALEDRASWAESFDYYRQGNLLKKAGNRYRPEITERNTALQIEVCDAALFERHAGDGCADPAPIFIVGLPRSGSTLIEQILAAHPSVEGTMELADVPRLAQELRGREQEGAPARYPRVLAQLTAAELRQLGERYVADTCVYRRSSRPRFIDKMPNNFRHIGLIRLMLPRARIIDARREPMACCFSNFKQLYAEGQEFTYSLEDLGRYYRSYVELMGHWDRVLPGHVLRVQYEQLVADLEGQVRRMLAYLELDFDPLCLEFHRSTRSVRTASSEQVRRPIYSEGLEHWRHYEPWLAQLREALGPLAGRTDPPPR